MSKGRKPAAAAKPAFETNDVNVRRSLDAVDTLAQATAAFGAEQEIAFTLFGRLQMAGGFSKIARAAEIKQYAEIRETKSFKYLPVSRADGNCAPAQNFEEFCDLTHPKGYRGVMEELQFLRTLGYPIYEALKNLNIDRKQFRTLLASPGEKLAELEAVDLTDPDAVRDHIEQLAEIAQRAESALATQQEENAANLDYTEGVVKQRDKYERQLKRLPDVRPWSDESAALVEEITKIVKEVGPKLGALNERIEQLGALMAESTPTMEEGKATAIGVMNAVHLLVNLLAPAQLKMYEEFQNYVPVTHTSLYAPKE